MDHDDDALVAELCRIAAQLDPPPPHLHEAARAVLAWRRADQELAALAELSADPVDDEPALAGVRSHGTPALFTFEADEVSVELEVAGTPRTGGLRLVGQIVPPQSGHVVVRQTHGELSVEVDELGRFRTDGVSTGPTSLRCRLGSGEAAHEVITDWITL